MFESVQNDKPGALQRWTDIQSEQQHLVCFLFFSLCKIIVSYRQRCEIESVQTRTAS